MQDDRRLYPRSKVRWPVEMIVPPGTMDGEMLDANTFGAYISCEKPLNPEERLIVSAKLPTGSLLEFPAEVVWSNPNSSDDEFRPKGMAVRFLQ